MGNPWDEARKYAEDRTGIRIKLGNAGSSASYSPEAKAAFDARKKLLLFNISEANIDRGTKEELMASANTTPDTVGIGEELRAAKAGEGKYAIRKRNFEFMSLLKDRPGASQLFGSSITRQQAGTGILTGNPQGILTPPKKA